MILKLSIIGIIANILLYLVFILLNGEVGAWNWKDSDKIIYFILFNFTNVGVFWLIYNRI